MAEKDPVTLHYISLSGTKFQISTSTFNKLQPHLDKEAILTFNQQLQVTEYFLERDVASFSAILNFHQSGQLHMPSHVCPLVYQQELLVWGVDWQDMSHCCLRKFVAFLQGEN